MNSMLRKKARTQLSNNWQVMLIACLIGLFFYESFNTLLFEFTVDQEFYQRLLIGLEKGDLSQLAPEEIRHFLVTLIFLFLVILLTSTVWIGFTWLTLDFMRHKTVLLSDLISIVRLNTLRMILFWFLYSVYLLGWLILFIVPGLIKMFSYSMAIYILKDNPSMSPNEAITQSRKLMDGRKTELLSLILSFAGWFLLTVLISYNATNLLFLAGADENTVVTDVLVVLLNLIIVSPFYLYLKATLAAYYQHITETPKDGSSDTKTDSQSGTTSVIF